MRCPPGNALTWFFNVPGKRQEVVEGPHNKKVWCVFLRAAPPKVTKDKEWSLDFSQAPSMAPSFLEDAEGQLWDWERDLDRALRGIGQ